MFCLSDAARVKSLNFFVFQWFGNGLLQRIFPILSAKTISKCRIWCISRSLNLILIVGPEKLMHEELGQCWKVKYSVFKVVEIVSIFTGLYSQNGGSWGLGEELKIENVDNYRFHISNTPVANRLGTENFNCEDMFKISGGFTALEGSFLITAWLHYWKIPGWEGKGKKYNEWLFLKYFKKRWPGGNVL